MKRLQIISIQSLSQRTGVLTFIEIFSRSIDFFSDRRLSISFNLQESHSEVFITRGEKDAITTCSSSKKSRLEFLKKVKILAKKVLLKSPHGSFLVMLYAWVLQGFIVSWRTALNNKPDIYFYQDIFVAYSGLYLHGMLSKRILVLHTGDDPLAMLYGYFPLLRGSIYQEWIDECFMKVVEGMNVVVTLNTNLADMINSFSNKKNAVCIYNTCLPFDRDQRSSYPWDKTKISVVCVGSLQYRKGFDILIQAIGMMPDRDIANLEVVIAGDGPDKEKLEKMVIVAKLGGVVKLIGQTGDVSYCLREADCFILCSRDEGLPIALIEATAFALPIITTNVGSIGEIFSDKDCIYIDTDPGSIAEVLKELTRKRIDTSELSRRSYSIYNKNFSLDTFLQSYANLFDDVIISNAQ